MANLRELIPAFFTGPNGQRLTPEQIAQRQGIAQSLMESAMDTSPTAGGWASVLAKGVQGYSAGRDRRLADRATEANATESQNAIAALLGGVGQSPSAPMAAQPSAMMPASGGASIMDSLPPVSGGSPASPVQEPSLAVASSNASAPAVGGDWLRYRNQGATRNQPLNEQLVSALGFLPELGVTAEVFSGGQPGKGSGLARVGSTRHDHGNAADVFFYQGDRRLDWNNEQDRPLFEQIVQRGKLAGITGFGAGPGYMQPGSMHIGFGNPGIWGAGGKAQNAPEWLANAYNGQAGAPSNAADATRAMAASQPQQAMASPQAAPVQQAQAGGINPAIVQALSSPYVDSNTRSIAGMLLGNQLQQQQQANDPMRAMQLEKAQLELEALRNPQPAAPPDAFQTLSLRAQAAGLQPGTPEFQQFMAGGGRSQEDSAAEQRIARMTENLMGTGDFVDPQEARNIAVGIVDGRLKADRHPVTGELQVVDMATGRPTYGGTSQQQQAAPSPLTQPGLMSPNPQQFGEQYPNANAAFGVEGAARNAVNTVLDAAGIGAPYQDTQAAQADFGVLRESLLNDMATSYGRQPPSWLLKEIRDLTPAAGSVFQGAGGAQSQLNALGRHLNNELAVTQQSLQRQLSPTNRQELEARQAGLEAAIGRVGGAIGAFDRQSPNAQPEAKSEDGWTTLPNGVRIRELRR